MKFMYLIYEDRELGATLPKEQIQQAIKAYQAFENDLKQTGHWVAGSMLDTKTTKTIEGHNGSATTKDGPFVKAKEQVGGYYVVEAKDLNEALKLAQRVPSAKWGAVEVKELTHGSPVRGI
jgi:hypothetical protein